MKCSKCIHWGATEHPTEGLTRVNHRWQYCSQHPPAYANADFTCDKHEKRTRKSRSKQEALELA